MGGGLMQLVAYGAQDIYLTGSPQITFFKVVYKRHTNFAVEPMAQTFTGQAGFGKSPNVQILRNGDLITHAYLNVGLPEVDANSNLTAAQLAQTQFAWCRRIGHAIIDQIEIDIGGSRIDRQYGDWLNVWYELTHAVGQERGYARMIGDVPELVELSKPQGTSNKLKDAYNLYIPLQLWFCRNNGLALPLIALQYHEVRIYFWFRRVEDCVVHSQNLNPKSLVQSEFDNASLLVDYIYLDTEERRRFAQVSHEYLIEQLQFNDQESVISNTAKYRLNFNHPTKTLYWGVKAGQYLSGKSFLAYEPFDWNKALKTAAEKLILGQYATNAADGSLITDESHTNGNYLTESVLVVDQATGKLDPETTAQVLVLDRTKVKFYASYDNSNDLADLVSGNIVVYADCAGKLFVHHVNVVSNKLTIANISVHTGNYVVDNRNPWIQSLDIVVNQQHNFGLFIDGSVNPVVQAKIQLNGQDRFDQLDGNYFNYVQPYQHFSNTPCDGINTYSFALTPEEHQPSGTCNFSRIDTADLFLTFAQYDQNGRDQYRNFLDSDTKISIFAVNYNVMRIMSGMGGLAYSN